VKSLTDGCGPLEQPINVAKRAKKKVIEGEVHLIPEWSIKQKQRKQNFKKGTKHKKGKLKKESKESKVGYLKKEVD